MDPISSLVTAITNPVLDNAALLIHNDALFVFILALLVVATERNPQKLWKIFIASVLVVVLALAIKTTFKVERPCANERFSALCSDSYSFPSIHTTLAFAVATAFLLKRAYPLYAIFALFVAFTRLYLGVHSLEDVSAGLALGVLGYYIVDIIWDYFSLQHSSTRQYVSTSLRKEVAFEKKRQAFHVCLGFAILLILLFLGRVVLIAALFTTAFLGSLLANRYALGRARGIDFLIHNLERKDVKIIGFGSALFVLGMLVLVTTLHTENEIAGGIVVFALGDAASTLFGLGAKHTLPWNRKKTVEGMAAFFFCALPAYYFVGILVFPLAFLCAIAETLSIGIDDNVLVPLVIVVFFLVV